MRYAQKADLIVLDGTGRNGNSRETSDKCEKLFLLINYRHSHVLPTVITTNLTPLQMEKYFEPRIVDRILEMNLRHET